MEGEQSIHNQMDEDLCNQDVHERDENKENQAQELEKEDN